MSGHTLAEFEYECYQQSAITYRLVSVVKTRHRSSSVPNERDGLPTTTS